MAAASFVHMYKLAKTFDSLHLIFRKRLQRSDFLKVYLIKSKPAH